jgi:hypothetical protein
VRNQRKLHSSGRQDGGYHSGYDGKAGALANNVEFWPKSSGKSGENSTAAVDGMAGIT